MSLPSGELKAIEAGYPTNVKWCCNQMLEKWLEMDTTATWGKIFTVIESSAMSNVPNKGDFYMPLYSCSIVCYLNLMTSYFTDLQTGPVNYHSQG